MRKLRKTKSLLERSIHWKDSQDLFLYFTINKKVEFGYSLYVCGNIVELGNWDIKYALKLNWRDVNTYNIFLII